MFDHFSILSTEKLKLNIKSYPTENVPANTYLFKVNSKKKNKKKLEKGVEYVELTVKAPERRCSN